MKKLYPLVIAAILATCISAIASATASAAECEALTVTSYCLGIFLATGKDTLYALILLKGKLESGAGNSKLTAESIGTVESSAVDVKVHLDETTAGAIEALEFAVEFLNSVLAGHPNCKVRSPDQAVGSGIIKLLETIGAYSEGDAVPGDFLFKPTGELFAEIQIEGCEQEAVLKIKGEQLCAVPSPETEAVVHLLECLFSGSSLTNGTKKAEFSGTFELEPESGNETETGAEESLTGKAWTILSLSI